MKRILHLSDLHFGTENQDVLTILSEDCLSLNPDVIVISGDLTQRAKHQQYKSAKEFINHFKDIPIVCVPGNHDISLYNLAERFIYPFAKYNKWIKSDISSHYADDAICILGVNSVTPYKPMSGYITDRQLKLVTNYFNNQPTDLKRIVVMHHNLIRSKRHKSINDADKILRVFANAGVNLVLSGHIHFPYIEKISKPFIKHNLYIITAGTPISTRTVAPNSYNIIDILPRELSLTIRAFRDDQFINDESSHWLF